MFLCQSTCERCEELALSLLHTTPTTDNQVFGEDKSCAIVTGDNCLLDFQYGDFIDSHDVVMRLNMHECSSPKSCGSRTTHRLLNNQYCQHRRGSGQVLQKLSRNITVIFNSYISDWDCMYNRMNGINLIPCFNKVAKSSPGSRFSTDPLFTQSAIAAFERLSNTRVKTLISTGYLAMYLLTKTCRRINAFGFCSIDNYNPRRWHDFDNEHKIYRKWSESKEINLKTYPWILHRGTVECSLNVFNGLMQPIFYEKDHSDLCKRPKIVPHNQQTEFLKRPQFMPLWLIRLSDFTEYRSHLGKLQCLVLHWVIFSYCFVSSLTSAVAPSFKGDAMTSTMTLWLTNI